ncbi:MAG TPA: DUF3604 domain-containing protein, partial [Candidatus Bathyarchaeota archaeon]|nr:DUF3604 domain-containing protein [Candidatus Bathyarchaeota archaeon]
TKPGYVTATTTGKAKLRVRYVGRYYVRPWRGCLVIDVYDGYLKKGDKVVVTYGDRSGGSPGFRMQTFREKEHTFRVLVDNFGTGRFIEVESSPVLRIIGGPPEKLEVVAPSLVTVDNPFRILVRALDSWGNPSDRYESIVHLKPTDPDAVMPRKIIFSGREGGIYWIEEVRFRTLGVHYIRVEDERGLTSKSNPIICKEDEPSYKIFWGDLHGQTRMTVGTGSLDEYFSFARDVAALDFCSWQGNDFQVTRKGWETVKLAVKKFHEPNRFITFLGYEWSGLTPEGGDHNIYFLGDDEQIYRSSHWLIDDKSDEYTDMYPISKLWETFGEREDVMAIPHVGGRYANLDYFNPKLSSLIEVHSCHGTFEWFIDEALERGLKVGFVAGSDDHTGRPGLAYPTHRISHEIASFDVKSGLTAVYAESLDRESLWDALKKRRCYATNGERIILNVNVNGHMIGEEFECADKPCISVDVKGTSPLIEIELKRGTETIYRHPVNRPASTGDRRILIEWGGVRSKGRAHKAVWDGELHLDNGRIVSVEEFAFDKPWEGAKRISNQEVKWRSTTSGDVDGIILEVDAEEESTFNFSTRQISLSFKLKDVTFKPLTFKAGGVNLKVRVWEISANPNSLNARFQYVDETPMHGVNPYWIRVMQRDGGVAWSSPIYVNYKG